MNGSTVNTAQTTDTTSLIPREPRTEEEFLQREADLAERGLMLSLRDMGGDVLDAVDLSRHTRRHPLRAMAVAAGLGFLLQGRLRAMARGDKASLTSSILLLFPISKLIQSSVVSAVLQRVAGMFLRR